MWTLGVGTLGEEFFETMDFGMGILRLGGIGREPGMPAGPPGLGKDRGLWDPSILLGPFPTNLSFPFILMGLGGLLGMGRPIIPWLFFCRMSFSTLSFFLPAGPLLDGEELRGVTIGMLGQRASGSFPSRADEMNPDVVIITLTISRTG